MRPLENAIWSTLKEVFRQTQSSERLACYSTGQHLFFYCHICTWSCWRAFTIVHSRPRWTSILHGSFFIHLPCTNDSIVLKHRSHAFFTDTPCRSTLTTFPSGTSTIIRLCIERIYWLYTPLGFRPCIASNSWIPGCLEPSTYIGTSMSHPHFSVCH